MGYDGERVLRLNGLSCMMRRIETREESIMRILVIDEEGTIHINEEKTAARRSKIKKLQDKLWKE